MKSKDFLDSRRNQAAVCRRCRPPNGCTIGPIVVLCAAQVPWCFELLNRLKSTSIKPNRSDMFKVLSKSVPKQRGTKDARRPCILAWILSEHLQYLHAIAAGMIPPHCWNPGEGCPCQSLCLENSPEFAWFNIVENNPS